jgi:hypothetical protein
VYEHLLAVCDRYTLYHRYRMHGDRGLGNRDQRPWCSLRRRSGSDGLLPACLIQREYHRHSVTPAAGRVLVGLYMIAARALIVTVFLVICTFKVYVALSVVPAWLYSWLRKNAFAVRTRLGRIAAEADAFAAHFPSPITS